MAPQISLNESILDVQLTPIRGDMAPLATAAIRSRVDVGTPMAAVAIRRQFEVRRRLDVVTGLTNHLFMSAGERIFGLPRMVKAPPRPSVRVVTICATRTKFRLMEVLVTLFTNHRFVLVGRRPVAFLAGDRRMQTDQRKARDLVVERNAFPPIHIVVAALAALTQLSFVGILLAMAGVARSRKLVPIEIAGVAGVALYFFVRAAKRVFGLVVVKTCRLPLNLIMTGLAFRTVPIRMYILQPVTRYARTI